MHEFKNPYQFAPLGPAPTAEDGDGLGWTDAADFRKNGPADGWSHAKPAEGHVSGRIVCRLTLDTPAVIGARQAFRRDGNDKRIGLAVVEPCEIDGRPVIPATTLKGLLSSVAETASCSAMRVFDGAPPVHQRKSMSEALHALGEVVEHDCESGLAIRPMTLPLLFVNRNGEISFDRNNRNKTTLWKSVFSNFIALKSYIGSYKHSNNSKPHLEIKLIDNELSKNNYYYMKLTYHRRWDLFENDIKKGLVAQKESYDEIQENTADFIQSPRLHFPRFNITKSAFIYDPCTIVAQFAKDSRYKYIGERQRMHEGRDWRFIAPELLPGARVDEEINDTCQLQIFGDFEDEGFVRGRVKLFEGDGDIPPTKKHEVFLPDPPDAPKNPPVPISVDALRRHDDIAGKDRRPRVREIVYFDVHRAADGTPEVCEISRSAIWRAGGTHATRGDGTKPIGVPTLADFLPDPEFAPFSSARESISPAERLFGFVQTEGRPSKDEPHVAQAGRVRPSAALVREAGPETFYEDPPTNGAWPPAAGADALRDATDFVPSDWTGGPIGEKSHTKLKILDAPKPPSPAFYFEGRKGAPTRLDTGDAVLRGRKLYLHHPPGVSDDALPQRQPWRTRTAGEAVGDTADRDGQRAVVRPLKAGLEFWFHLDVDNLGPAEFDLLVYALRPSEGFRHKIGLGKPLGLGTIRIDPVAFFEVDPKARYGGSLFAPRYARIEVAEGTPLPTRYAKAAETRPEETRLDFVPFAEGTDSRLCRARMRHRERMARRGDEALAALAALEAVGEAHFGVASADPWSRVSGTGEPDVPVAYPLTTEQYEAGGAQAEDELFAWFTANKAREHKAAKMAFQQRLRRPSEPPLPGMTTRPEPRR